jgi:peptidoglycan lytic transglycosylase G
MGLAAKAKKAEFTEYQVLIEASLLEGEVPPQYYGQVARVIDNRLNAVPEMTLGLDSTVAYAVNKYIYNLTQSDLNVNSPYNTTKHLGLPPGPIDSPDAAAIDAVLHPAKGTWLYFVTVNKSGLTKFTDSSTQFNIWVNEAKQNGLA